MLNGVSCYHHEVEGWIHRWLKEATVDRQSTQAALAARTTLLRKSRYPNIASIAQENFINT